MAYEKRASWEDQYFIASHSTSILQHDSATTGVYAGTLGIGLTTNGLLLDDHPDIMSGVETTTTEKTTGLSQTKTGTSGVGVELVIGKKLPTFSISAMGYTEMRMALLGWAFFQKGASQGATPGFTKTFIPYVAGGSGPETWLAIGRSIGDKTANTIGKSLTGCIVTTMGINYASGERVTMSAELIGRDFVSAYNHSASNSTVDPVADHMAHDYNFTFAGTTANVSAFDVSLANNAIPLYYNEIVPSSYVLGRLNVTGSISIALSTTTLGDNVQLDNFVAGTDVLIVMDHNTTAFSTVKVNAHYTGAEIDPAEELMYNLAYEGVTDGTNDAIEIIAKDSIDRSIA